MSLTTDKARALAQAKGAWAGKREARHLFDLPKRVLVELALRSAAQAGGECDSFEAGLQRLCREEQHLAENSLI